MSAIVEDWTEATGLEVVNPHPSSQEGSTKECVLKNVLAVGQLHSSPMGFKLGLEKAEEPETKLPTFTGS